jgi:hypothetical protein
MNQHNGAGFRLTEQSVREDFQRQPHLFLRLAENALTVAESLRDNYFKNTTRFVTVLRRAMRDAADGKRTDPVLTALSVPVTDWSDLHNEVVTFIDGGVGQAQISNQLPILLRVGSYCVRTGERQLAEREQFGYYPVILGDLEGGSKERDDFVAIVRTIAELLGGLSALERNPDLRVLMFHGPLVNLVGLYTGHKPFTEQDIDLFLEQYSSSPAQGQALKEAFLEEAYVNIYPQMTDRAYEWVERRLFEPLAWMAFLYRRLIQTAQCRTPTPIIAGVVERSRLREFSENILLERIFLGLRKKQRINYFNEMYGRTDLISPRALLDRLGYTDTLLLAMLLQPGEFAEPWEINKYAGLQPAELALPGESWSSRVNFAPLRPGRHGFPRVRGCYLHVAETTEPVRIEVFDELGPDQIEAAVARVYRYARLLPGYGFPVGLDIADKYAQVPTWLTEAYGKLIRYHLGVSLQQGEISDAELRRILVQAVYMTHRDWLFRPQG